MMDLGTLGDDLYPMLLDEGLGDVYKVTALNDAKLDAIMKKIGAPPGHIKIFKIKVRQKRLQLLKRDARR